MRANVLTLHLLMFSLGCFSFSGGRTDGADGRNGRTGVCEQMCSLYIYERFRWDASQFRTGGRTERTEWADGRVYACKCAHLTFIDVFVGMFEFRFRFMWSGTGIRGVGFEFRSRFM
jgi:hypothetical protein